MASHDDEFVEYVAARRARLQRTAFLLCGDPHRAEDIVQTALTKLYLAWPRARRADSVDAYVRRVIVNTHLSDRRRAAHRYERTGLQAVPDPIAVETGPEDRDDLWSALRELPAAKRRVVVLRHYWGLSVAETAEDLGISTGTVKSQTHEAIAILRSRLATRPRERTTTACPPPDPSPAGPSAPARHATAPLTTTSRRTT